MSKIETISELNTKSWYRLTKVIYALFFIFLLATLFSIIPQTKKHINLSESTVDCYNRDVNFKLSALYTSELDLKRQEEFRKNLIISLHCRKVYQTLYPETVKPLTEEDKKEIREQIQRIREESELEKLGIATNNSSTEDTAIDYDAFKINFVTYWEPSVAFYVLELIGVILTVTVIFVMIQRLFYYIILGKIFPKK